MVSNTPKTLHDIEIYYDGNLVGRATSLNFSRKQAGKFHHQNSSKNPYAITTSGLEPQGTIVRTWVDNDLLQTLYDFEEGNNPSLDLIGVEKVDGNKWLIKDATFLGFDFASSFEESTLTHEFYALKITPVNG